MQVDEVIERLRARRAVVAVDRSPEGRTDIYGQDALCRQAADLLASMKEALERIARLGVDMKADFSRSAQQSGIARNALTGGKG